MVRRLRAELFLKESFNQKISFTLLIKGVRALLSKKCYADSPPHEKLVGDLSGVYSRKINIQHRIVYQVLQEQKTVKIIRLWSHYE